MNSCESEIIEINIREAEPVEANNRETEPEEMNDREREIIRGLCSDDEAIRNRTFSDVFYGHSDETKIIREKVASIVRKHFKGRTRKHSDVIMIRWLQKYYSLS